MGNSMAPPISFWLLTTTSVRCRKGSFSFRGEENGRSGLPIRYRHFWKSFGTMVCESRGPVQFYLLLRKQSTKAPQKFWPNILSYRKKGPKGKKAETKVFFLHYIRANFCARKWKIDSAFSALLGCCLIDLITPEAAARLGCWEFRGRKTRGKVWHSPSLYFVFNCFGRSDGVW